MVKTAEVLCGVMLILAGVLGIAGGAVFRKVMVRRKDQSDPQPALIRNARRCGVDPAPLLQGADWVRSQKGIPLTIESREGLRLCGTYLKAQGVSRGRILLFHGYRSSCAQDFCLSAPWLHQMDYDLLMVDQRAHGKSEGRYIGFGTLERWDCLLWTAEMNRRFGDAVPTFLMGVSMGATTVLLASGEQLPGNIRGVVADCGFTSAREILRYQLKKRTGLPPFPMVGVVGLINRAVAKWRLDGCSTVEALERETVPVLFLHGGGDEFVPPEMTRRNYQACRSEKELLMVEGAEHAMSFAVDPDACRRAVGGFLRRYG